MNFQTIVEKLSHFWNIQGCLYVEGTDYEVGSGTLHPLTFLSSLGPEPWAAFYVQTTRRPVDGRYGENPNHLQKYHQFQVIIKPPPSEIQDIFLRSIENLGFNGAEHDLRFMADDWECPTLGASGLGWEILIDGMQVAHYTYFQQCGGIELEPITVEITYSVERVAMLLQNKSSIFDLMWSEKFSYSVLNFQNELQHSIYNFEIATISTYVEMFNLFEKEVHNCLKSGIVLPAYEFVLKCSHAFNMLEARKALSVTQRTTFIKRIRELALKCADAYIENRKNIGYPLLQ